MPEIKKKDKKTNSEKAGLLYSNEAEKRKRKEAIANTTTLTKKTDNVWKTTSRLDIDSFSWVTEKFVKKKQQKQDTRHTFRKYNKSNKQDTRKTYLLEIQEGFRLLML